MEERNGDFQERVDEITKKLQDRSLNLCLDYLLNVFFMCFVDISLVGTQKMRHMCWLENLELGLLIISWPQKLRYDYNNKSFPSILIFYFPWIDLRLSFLTSDAKGDVITILDTCEWKIASFLFWKLSIAALFVCEVFVFSIIEGFTLNRWFHVLMFLCFVPLVWYISTFIHRLVWTSKKKGCMEKASKKFSLKQIRVGISQ